nr:tail fiber protein [Azospirillum sp. SYSU D00513]
MWAFPWAPRNWALCDGSILQITQSTALYALLGTVFGGDGKTTFALPDLRGRTPMGIGATPGTTTPYQRGNVGGAETVALTINTVPAHSHNIVANPNPGTALAPAGAMMANVVPAPGVTADFSVYLPGPMWTAQAQLNAGTLSSSGGNQPHNNMQPFAVVNFCIATTGNFPPRN